MATYYSEQQQKGNLNYTYPPQKLYPYDNYGRVRISRFTFKVGTDDILAAGGSPQGINSGDVITGPFLPPQAVIIGGRVTFSGTNTSATLSIGDSGSATKFLGATSIASAGASDFANTQALGAYTSMGNTPTAQPQVAPGGDTLLLTIGGASLASNAVIDGHVLFVVD